MPKASKATRVTRAIPDLLDLPDRPDRLDRLDRRVTRVNKGDKGDAGPAGPPGPSSVPARYIESLNGIGDGGENTVSVACRDENDLATGGGVNPKENGDDVEASLPAQVTVGSEVRQGWQGRADSDNFTVYVVCLVVP